jgi:hypothetical protein
MALAPKVPPAAHAAPLKSAAMETTWAFLTLATKGAATPVSHPAAGTSAAGFLCLAPHYDGSVTTDFRFFLLPMSESQLAKSSTSRLCATSRMAQARSRYLSLER